MKTALVLGCSHAAGTELGTEEFGRQHSFPVLVARSLGYTVTNLAEPGGSNDRIFRIFLEQHTQFDLVVVAWTGIDRSEIYYQNRWQKLLPSHAEHMKSLYEKQWCVYHTHEKVGRLNKIKNVLAVNSMATVPVINCDSFWPVTDQSWPTDLIWPLTSENNFLDWCVRHDYKKNHNWHFEPAAHQHYAELITQRLGSQVLAQ